MKRILSGAILALFLSLAANAAGPVPTKVVRLYPEGQGVDRGIVENGVQITLGPLEDNGLRGASYVRNQNRNMTNIGDDACLEIYLPEKCNGQMIVDAPGGAYWVVSMNNEGSFAADWLLQRGYAVCVVMYRLPNHHHCVPLRDMQNAMRYCRAHATEWGVKQIGVMGYSAGGHLAASASTLYVDEVTRPDFSVLVYPVITMEEFVTHAGTRNNLMPKTADKALVERYSLERQVNAQTPPAILLLCADDDAVQPENAIRYYQAMQRHGVPGELHIFSKGGHGWGFNIEKFGIDDHLSPDVRKSFCETMDRWLSELRRQL